MCEKALESSFAFGVSPELTYLLPISQQTFIIILIILCYFVMVEVGVVVVVREKWK